MKSEFRWDKSKKKLAFDKTGGKEGRLFYANEAKRLMDPYVPANNLVLAQNTRVYVEGEHGVVEYLSPYAHYQYEGELYISSKTGSAWAKEGEYKVPAGKKLNHSKFRHPLATDHWDKAMTTARNGELTKAMQEYLEGSKG